MASSITVYGTPTCVQCKATTRTLRSAGVEFDSVDLNHSPEIADALRAEGFAQMPVVKTDRGAWSGFRPDLIRQLGGVVPRV